MKTVAVIFAAGKGTRMNSSLPKVLHKIGGEPMILRTIMNLKKSRIDKIYVVVGYKKQLVKSIIKNKFSNIKFVNQSKLDGTGGALRTFWKRAKIKPTYLICMNGDDSFLYKPQTFRWILRSHIRDGHGLSVLTCKSKREFTYRKVFRDKRGNFLRLTKNPTKRGEIVCGLYVFSKRYLVENLGLLKRNKKTVEYGIVDFMYLRTGYTIGAYRLRDPNEWFGVNTKEDLKEANKIVAQNR